MTHDQVRAVVIISMAVASLSIMVLVVLAVLGF